MAPGLRNAGHDVRAADEERELDACSDEKLLALAAADHRIIVTCDVGDFARIIRRWAAAGRSHTGCALLVGIRHREFGMIIRRLDAALRERPDPTAWIDYTAFVSRGR